MPFVDKGEKLCAWGEEEAHVQLSHSFELSKSISGHDFESEKAANIRFKIMNQNEIKHQILVFKPG